MIIPDRVNGRWVATLKDDQLVKAEAQLHAVFIEQERLEKKQCGSRYTLLEGPEPLITAWHRWILVNNETQTRGIMVRRRR